jgi:hypothetical protein
MMTIPLEMMDFIYIANAICTVCVQKAKPGASAGRSTIVAAAPLRQVALR